MQFAVRVEDAVAAPEVADEVVAALCRDAAQALPAQGVGADDEVRPEDQLAHDKLVGAGTAVVERVGGGADLAGADEGDCSVAYPLYVHPRGHMTGVRVQAQA